MTIYEDTVEHVALGWLRDAGWVVLHGPDIAPGEERAERADYGQVVLAGRVRRALEQFNPSLPEAAREEAFRKLTRPAGSNLEARNRAFHQMLVNGVTVEYRHADGEIRGAQARVVDFENAEHNGWLAVNQFTVAEGQHQRRPDVVLFLNGLPLGIVELKNPGDPNATVWSAWQQLQTYKAELPTLFSMNELLVVSDGVKARVGTLTAGKEWFKPWRTISGEKVEEPAQLELHTVVNGLLHPQRLLPMLRDFIVFEDAGSGALSKKMAGYHQFHAVQAAVGETLRASKMQRHTRQAADANIGRYETRRSATARTGDRRVGVIWHTQGSGKSLTMAFYAGRIIREEEMQNPTLVVLTDRNDLDEQLFATFSRCQGLLRQTPVRAENRADLRKKLAVNAGGVVFTTIHKFFPEAKGDRNPQLSPRPNIVVIADEAHRSQYDFIDGYARHMRDALPNASFIGFTGTPIEKADANTRAVFGDYISIYDIQRAVTDKATVPIYYESRLARLQLDEQERPKIDPDFEEVTEGEEDARKERLKSKWAQVEAIVGADGRLTQVATDIVEHFEQRCEALTGKAMVVCMSRRICVELYQKIVALRPGWHAAQDHEGEIKIVMTGSAADPTDWQPHIRSKKRRELLANRFRDPDDELKIVLVRDMWLTGFDAPALHTMYNDKPMRGHGLMQAVARVNRVFRDKPGGLIVDYLGLAQELKEALATYTESGGEGKTTLDQEEAVAVMLEKYEICCALLHGFDWSAWFGDDAVARLAILPAAQECILAQEKGKERFVRAVSELSKAFALSVPHEEALRIRDDVAFFQTLQGVLAKRDPGAAQDDEELNHAVRQIIARAVAPEGVVDLFAAAGIKKPDLSILSDEFLAEVRGMPHRNLAAELLQKLLRDEVTVLRRRNLVQSRSFAEMLEKTIRKYQNRTLEAAQVVEELIKLAEEMRAARARGDDLNLTEDELAFYDALETSDSAVKVLGDAALCAIARELIQKVRSSITVDWALRENVRANIRVMVKRILRKHGYPPDKEEDATNTVLEQAELLSSAWAGV